MSHGMVADCATAMLGGKDVVCSYDPTKPNQIHAKLVTGNCRKSCDLCDDRDVSQVHPRLDFIGTKFNNTFTIDSVPSVGQTTEQMFMLTDIGQLIALKTHAIEEHPWLVENIAYREVLNVKDTVRGQIQYTSVEEADTFHYHNEHELLYAPLPFEIQESYRKALLANETGSDVTGLFETDVTTKAAHSTDLMESASTAAMRTLSDDEVEATADAEDDAATTDDDFIPMGSNGWLDKEVASLGIKHLDTLPVAETQLARPKGTGCHCNGKQAAVDERLTKYGVSKMGGYCGEPLKDDPPGKSWCYVDEECSGHEPSVFDLDLLWAWCKPSLAPVELNIRPVRGDAGIDGQLSVQIWGQDGLHSKMVDVDMSVFDKVGAHPSATPTH